MPNYTNRLKLKKPLQSEYYNVEDFNNNFETIDRNIVLFSDMANCFTDLISNGVVSLNNDFLITYNGDMSITIGPGVAWDNGYRISSTGMKIDIEPVTDDNIYYYVISIARTETGGIRFYTIKSTVPTPNPPGIFLYEITLNKSTVEITPNNVIDKRTEIFLKVRLP